MRITYDPRADALYIELRDVAHRRTKEITPGVHLDYDDGGKLVGVEVLDASTVTAEPLNISLELLATEAEAAAP